MFPFNGIKPPKRCGYLICYAYYPFIMKNLLVVGALIAAVLSMTMAMVVQNVQVVKAEPLRGCTGNPHDDGETGNPHDDDDTGNPHSGSHHVRCHGDK